MLRRGAGIEHNAAQDVGRLYNQLLRLLSFSAAITYSSYFLGFNFLDEHFVAAEALPSIGGKVVLFLHVLFGKKPFGVARQVTDELGIILEPCRLAM